MSYLLLKKCKYLIYNLTIIRKAVHQISAVLGIHTAMIAFLKMVFLFWLTYLGYNCTKLNYWIPYFLISNVTYSTKQLRENIQNL